MRDPRPDVPKLTIEEFPEDSFRFDIPEEGEGLETVREFHNAACEDASVIGSRVATQKFGFTSSRVTVYS